jgi:hypothetical protein
LKKEPINITLIFSKHRAAGQCNAENLLRIILAVKPEVIFEELSFSNFHKIYKEQCLTTLESDAIKQHLLTNAIKQVPVDTYDLPIDYYKELDLMYDKLIYGQNQDSYSFRKLLEQQSGLEAQYGFPFLNSLENETYFEKIDAFKQQIVAALKDENLQRILRLEKEMIDKREEAMLNNVYRFAKANAFNAGLMFIGSGHQITFIKKIEERKHSSDINIDWQFYSDVVPNLH